MEEELQPIELLQRYRCDRIKLLNFILSGNLIKKVVMPPGAVTLDDVDLDQVSIDYVLNCAKKGEMLELSEAIRDHYDKLGFAPTMDTGSAEEFYLVTDPYSSGAPPMRAPPSVPISTPTPIVSSISKSYSLQSPERRELTVDDIDDFDDDDNDGMELAGIKASRRQRNDASDLVLDLPSFTTGLTEDDLRETAYEILLASVGAAGVLIVPSKEKKKERKLKLLKKLSRSKSENVVPQNNQGSSLAGLLETMRVQLEISDSMDVRTRQALLLAQNGRVGKRMDTLLVPLELLCCISQAQFSDKKAYMKWQKRQLNVLEEGLLNLPAVPYVESARKANEMRALLAKFEEAESLPSTTGENQRTGSLKTLREITLSLAERPGRGDLTGEVCHWADGYHLNIRLYEKLLYGVFDIFDDGKLSEEVAEILELLKSTWRILGITEAIHYTCYAWVLFRQFVISGEQTLLQHASEILKKVPLEECRSSQEKTYLKSLRSSFEGEMGNPNMPFLQSVLNPIKRWTDKRLGDYHLNFTEGPNLMEGTLAIAMLSLRLLNEEPAQVRQSFASADRDQIKAYISSSIGAAFGRIVQGIGAKSESAKEHDLASLAEEIRKLIKRESTMFSPILSRWNEHAIVLSASLLHQLYGEQLRPFLDSAEHLTEDAVCIFPAADGLEQYMMGIVMASCEEEIAEDWYKKKIIPYQIETISGMLVLRWVNAQLGRVLEWVERAVQQESWDPLSPQQRHGSSIVEVYRIVEETVDQFFALKVPMRFGELNSIFRGLDNAFQVYTRRVIELLGSKEELVPPVPILTRYKKESAIKALVKKEAIDPRMPDYRRSSQINVLSTPKLCVRLNTLYYAISHLSKLEDSIRERWSNRRYNKNTPGKSAVERSRSSVLDSQSDAFDGARKDINAAIDKLCDFTGTKVIFWDLREPFIDGLYKPTVSQSRLEVLIESFDGVLNQLVVVIVDPLRDRLVSGLLQASLDGLARILLDGGPSRLFTSSDAKLLQEDLDMLKEFFISGGDGLPRGKVENLAARAQLIVKIQSLETRELIDDLKTTSLQGTRSRLGADTEMLLRVLCHRADSEASQFLKKQYKIPSSSA